jgi:hypothetical protein
MEKYVAIEIKQVNNGFIITPAYNASMHGTIMDDESIVVYNDFEQMVEWLARHFGEMSDEQTR